jgi:hypothetical protein
VPTKRGADGVITVRPTAVVLGPPPMLLRYKMGQLQCHLLMTSATQFNSSVSNTHIRSLCFTKKPISISVWKPIVLLVLALFHLYA